MLTKNDFVQIQKIVQHEIRQEAKPLRKDVKLLKADIRYIKDTINEVITAFDNEDEELRKRVQRIENHLDLPSSSR